MKYFLYVDPNVLKLNRDMHVDHPPLVIRDDEHNQLDVAHRIPIYNGELVYFRDQERHRMGPHVAIVVEGPLKYEVDGEWKEMP